MQCTQQTLDGGIAIGPPCDEFRQQRVVFERYSPAVVNARVNADARSSGFAKLDDLAGPVKIVSGGGNIEGGNLGNDFSVTSGAADVRVANVGGQTQVNLGGGRVYIGTTHTSTIQTGAGSIQVQKCIGDLHVTSGGGNLYLGDVDGAVQAETEGGSVRLASASGPVRVTTGGGSVELYKLARGAQVDPAFDEGRVDSHAA